MWPSRPISFRSIPASLSASPTLQRIVALAVSTALPLVARAQGFEKIESTVNNVQTILITISVAVVTIAVLWAGFKMIFQSARLADVANVLFGGTLVGGAGAFAAYIVN